MKTGLFTLKWHNLWRSDIKSNIAISIMCCAIAVAIWAVVTCISESCWTETLESLLKSGTTDNVSEGVHIFLGLVGSVFISPFIVALAITIIRRSVEKVQLGQKRYKFISGHIIMIGYNQYSASVILNLFSKEENRASVLVILTTNPPKALRAELCALLPEEIEKRIIIYAGSPQSEEHICQLRLHAAKAVYITLDGQEWDSAYTRAMSILPLISRATQYRPKDNYLPVNLMINDEKAYEVARALTLPRTFRCYEGKQNLDIHIYNFYVNWARLLWSYNGLKENDEYKYDSLDFRPLVNSAQFVHLVIVGCNNMGKALLQEAVRICHYPNFDAGAHKGITRITVIDKDAEKHQRDFEVSCPYFSKQVKDIAVDFKQASIEDRDVRQQLAAWAKDKNRLLTIAVCLEDPDAAMQAALNLPEEVYLRFENLKLIHINKDKAGIEGEKDEKLLPRVLVRQAVRNDIREVLKVNKKHYAHLKIFGTYTEGACIDFLNDDMAILANGLYAGRYNDMERISDIEQLDVCKSFPEWRKAWYEATEEDRQKTRYQIDMYRSVFAFLHNHGVGIGKILQDPEILEQLAEVEHRRWIADVTLMGYRQKKRGEKRVDDVRVHNCIEDYHELSRAEQLKDHVVVKAAPVLSAWEKQVHEELL